MTRWAPVLVSLVVVLACGDDDSSSGTTSTGTGGTTSTSPTGGEGGTSSGTTSSTGGGGGATGGGGSAPVGSEGCGMASADPTEEWVLKTVDSGGVTREYFVYLPPGYDPATPYPVVYQFHGCSSQAEKQNNNPPVQDESGAAAIHVRGRAVDNCWDNSAGGTDVAFFDALVAAVEGEFCADPTRRFATGYSSGAFMSHRLACERGDQLRGVATIAGGLAGNNCVGQVAALLIHDADDSTVMISTSESARDRHLQNNGCGDAQGPTTPTGFPPCVEYTDCDAGLPVVWCQTTGQNHSRQDGLSAPAFWDFLSSLE